MLGRPIEHRKTASETTEGRRTEEDNGYAIGSKSTKF